MDQSITTLSKEAFDKELKSYLTILKNLTENENLESGNYTYYVCEYISPALHKKIILVAVKN